MARWMRSGSAGSKAVVRATNEAPFTAAVPAMSMGRSRSPEGDVAVWAPVGVATEYWPPVMPKHRLLNTSTVTPMFRRAALMRWCPPMPQPPSPISTITVSSGRASLMPLA